MLPPTPPRLSTITGWFHASLSLCDKMRAMVSDVPPAGNGATMRMGFAGYVCADALSTMQPATAAKHVISVRGIMLPFL